ncbi:MAG TPA: phosphatase PAP2 family protein [Thermoanaerobaculia bacterium]|nr:phosphatase PAP2 family protein [Thermoanaerobaculia bacterium]
MYFVAFLATLFLLWGSFYALLPLLRYAGRRIAHYAARLSIRFPRVQRVTKATYLPVVLIVLAGAVVGMSAGDAFLDVAELVHDRSPLLQTIDFQAHKWMAEHRTPGATLFFVALSTVGGPVGIAAILAVTGIALAVRGRWRWAAYLAITAVGGGLLDMELKLYFARARPALAEALRQAHGYSFPSGHAMGSTVAFGALSYLAMRALPRTRWKAAAFAFAATLILFVSLSRIYLGVHWVSDVGAGIVAGTLWVTATTVAYETFRRVRAIRARRQAAITSAATTK